MNSKIIVFLFVCASVGSESIISLYIWRVLYRRVDDCRVFIILHRTPCIALQKVYIFLWIEVRTDSHPLVKEWLHPLAI